MKPKFWDRVPFQEFDKASLIQQFGCTVTYFTYIVGGGYLGLWLVVQAVNAQQGILGGILLFAGVVGLPISSFAVFLLSLDVIGFAERNLRQWGRQHLSFWGLGRKGRTNA